MDNRITKRGVLKSVSASGIGFISAMGTGSANTENKSYEKITGKNREITVKRAVHHGQTKKLLEEIQVEENNIIEDDAIVYSVDDEELGLGRHTRVVIADIEAPKFEDVPTLTWTDNPDADQRAYVSTINYENSIEKQLFVEGESIQTIETGLSPQSGGIGISSNNYYPDPGGGGGSSDCVYLQEECTEIQWTCVVDVLITYGACASAIIPSLQKAAVLLCLADVGNSALQGTMEDVGCSICSDTDVREIDVCSDGWDINPP